MNEESTDRHPAEDEDLAALLGSLRSDLAAGEEMSVHRVDARLRAPSRPVARVWSLPAWVTLAAVGATAVVVALIMRPSAVPEVPSMDVGVEVVADADGVVSALPGGEATFSLMPDSSLRRVGDGDAGEPTFELDRGIVTVDVTPGALPGLVLEAGDVQVAVLGTSYVVSRDGDRVVVSVLRGVVQVMHGGLVRRLERGESYSTDEPPAAPVEIVEVESPSDALALVEPPTPVIEEPTAGEDPLALSPAESEFLDIQDALSRGATAEELLESTTRYLDRHAGGPFSVEVEAFRVEAMARTGRHREAFDLAGAFCAAHPDSPRRTQLLWLRATVARDRLRDCSLALESYRELAGLPGASGADASYYRAVCALDQQLLEEAEQGFRRYLELAPEGEHVAHAVEMLQGLSEASPSLDSQ